MPLSDSLLPLALRWWLFEKRGREYKTGATSLKGKHCPVREAWGELIPSSWPKDLKVYLEKGRSDKSQPHHFPHATDFKKGVGWWRVKEHTVGWQPNSPARSEEPHLPICWEWLAKMQCRLCLTQPERQRRGWGGKTDEDLPFPIPSPSNVF